MNISNAVERDIEYNDKRSIKKLLAFLSSDKDLGEVINKILNMKLNLLMLFQLIKQQKLKDQEQKDESHQIQVKKKKSFDDIFG